MSARKGMANDEKHSFNSSNKKNRRRCTRVHSVIRIKPQW